MGAKGSTAQNKQQKVPTKTTKLNEKDYKFLTAQTGLSREDITRAFDQFNLNNPGKILDF